MDRTWFDSLADLIATMATGYTPTAAAMIVDGGGTLLIVPGPDVPPGSVLVVTRRRIAHMMVTASLTTGDLRTCTDGRFLLAALVKAAL